MIKYIGKSTVEIRVETEQDADDLHKQMAKEAEEMGAVLTTWTQTKRNKKEKGEIIEEWYVCKATTTFCDLKKDLLPLKKITYDLGGDIYNDDVPFDGGTVLSAF